MQGTTQSRMEQSDATNGAPVTTRNKKLLGAKGIATRSKRTNEKGLSLLSFSILRDETPILLSMLGSKNRQKMYFNVHLVHYI